MSPAFSWPDFSPLPVSNLFSMYGVLFLHWSVADIFFWFWFELLTVGLALIALTFLWCRVEKDKPQLRAIIPFTPYLVIFSFLMILFYATLFTAMAYKGEWKSWDRFPEFVADKKIGLIATAIVTAAYFVRFTAKKNYGVEDDNKIVRLFWRRSLVIAGVYAILMFQYHFTGARRLDVSPRYLTRMGVLLLSLKFLAELGFFDRFTRRTKMRG